MCACVQKRVVVVSKRLVSGPEEAFPLQELPILPSCFRKRERKWGTSRLVIQTSRTSDTPIEPCHNFCMLTPALGGNIRLHFRTSRSLPLPLQELVAAANRRRDRLTTLHSALRKKGTDTAKMSYPSLAPYIMKRPWLMRWMRPLSEWYFDNAGYRKLGLRYILLYTRSLVAMMAKRALY